MIDVIQEIDAFEPVQAVAPAAMAPATMFVWAGMFAAVYLAASSILALMYARR